MTEMLLARGPYVLVVVLAVIGAYVMMSRRTLLKSLVGLYVFQTAVILLFVALSFRAGATVPIAFNDQPMHNPLPHAMMLTAIVVGVATVGVAVAILRRIQSESGSVEDTGS